MSGFMYRLRKRYYDILTHNRKVKNFLADINDKTGQIEDIGKVSDIINEIKAFSQKTSLKFTYSHIWATVIPLLLIAYMIGRVHRAYALYWLIASAVASVILFIFSYSKNQAFLVAEISDKLFLYSLFSQNRLKYKEKLSLNEGKKAYGNLRIRFCDFNRGDEDRYISRLVDGEYSLQEISFTYQYYEFHYVDVEDYATTDKDGKRTKEKARHTRYRYGLLLSFPYARNIILGSGKYYKEEWTTSSSEFNKYWDISASDRMQAAKFLKPAMVLSLLELAKTFSDVVIEVNYESVMCISFSEDMLNYKRKYSIQKPDKFEKEIFGGLALKRLDQMLKHICAIFKYSQV